MEIPPTLQEQIEVIQEAIYLYRKSFTCREGRQKGQIVEAHIRQEVACLEATRRVLLWASQTPGFASYALLTTQQRTELKGLEAAALDVGTDGQAMAALNEKERAYDVYLEIAPRPRWQD